MFDKKEKWCLFLQKDFMNAAIQQGTDSMKWQHRKQHYTISMLCIYVMDRQISLPGNTFNKIASSARAIQVTRLANGQT